MTRAATVDIGTNSVLLLAVEADAGGHARILDERCVITRLGEGIDGPGKPLSAAAVHRTLTALAELAAVIEGHGATRRAAIGTAALRDAADSDSFRAQAEALLGCPLEIISGEREAALALAGVRGAFGALPEGSVVFDVGGGSTELTRVPAAGDAVESVSLPLGALRLSERYLRHDPPSPGEVAAVREAVRQGLAALPAGRERPPTQLIGLGGTVTALCTIELGLVEYDTDKVNGQALGRPQLEEHIRRFAGVTLAERRRIPGLPAARADIILGGALVVEGILDRFGGDRLRVCDRGVRWGRMWELLAGPADGTPRHES